MGVQSFGLNLILVDPGKQEGGSCAACQGNFCGGCLGLLLSRLQQFCLPLRLVLENSFFTDPSPWAYVCHHTGCGLSEHAQNRRHREAGGRVLMAASGSYRAEAGDLCVVGHQHGNLVRPRREAGCRCGDRDGVF